MFGSFLSNTDLQSGSPSFGTPESAISLLHQQIATRLGLPWRSGGGLTSSQTVDAQPPEALMTMLPTSWRGPTSSCTPPGGWSRPGQLLREVHRRHRDPAPCSGRSSPPARGRRGQPRLRRPPGGRPRRPLPGGRAHAGAVPRLLLPAAAVVDENFERWKSKGGRDATERAGEMAGDAGEIYEQPAIDPACAGGLEGVRRPTPDRARRLRGGTWAAGWRRAWAGSAPRRRSRCWRGRRRSRRPAARVIHLEIGEPDFATPAHIVEAGMRGAARRPHPLLPGAGCRSCARRAPGTCRYRGLDIDPGAVWSRPGQSRSCSSACSRPATPATR